MIGSIPCSLREKVEREKKSIFTWSSSLKKKGGGVHHASLYVICLWLYGRTSLNDGTTQVIQTSWRASRDRVFIDWRHLRGWNELIRRAILRNVQHVHVGKIQTSSTILPHPSCRCRESDAWNLPSRLKLIGRRCRKASLQCGLDEVLTERRENLDCSRGEIQLKKDRKAELKA